MTSTVCLTLLVPLHAEERLIDFLLAQTDAAIEFSMHSVAARGPLVHMQPGEDQVRGHATRVEAKLILPEPLLAHLMPRLERLLAGSDGGWWITRVGAFGQFGRGVCLPAASAPRRAGPVGGCAVQPGETVPSDFDEARPAAPSPAPPDGLPAAVGRPGRLPTATLAGGRS
ncbi:MAG: hypothetical protein RLZZ584_241 [Pseudomonadota bacterium]|jgi:hypothetical protein